MRLPRKPSTLAVFLLAFLALTARSQMAAPKSDASVTAPSAIHELFLDDQSDRSGDRKVGSYGADVNERDAVRRRQVRKLLAAGSIQSAQDFHDAAYIFQHGQEPEDYLLAHILAVEAVVKGDATSKWISAATLDRYLQAIGQRQVFGTQYSDKSYVFDLEHKNDPAAMNKPDANQKGMTQEPFDKSLIPDTLRKDFCVPNLNKQKENLAEFEAGKYPDGIIPPGCTR